MIITGKLSKKDNQSCAWLDCELGRFLISNASKYPLGTTGGIFEVTQIKPTMVEKNNAFMVAVEAIVKEAYFQATEKVEQVPLFTELPVEKEEAIQTETLASLCEAVGLSYPLDNNIMLDASLPREVLVKQRDLLKSQSYNFNVTTQTWTKEAQ